MHHTIAVVETLVLPDSGFAFEVGSLYERLEALSDARQARGKRYSLALVLTLLVLAKLSGEDHPAGIADWARQRTAELIDLLPLERETLPCANTYRNVVSRAVSPEALQQTVSEFLQAQAGTGRGVLLCIDGKTLRGTLDPANRSGVHLLAAYLPDAGLVLLQLAVDAQTNEIRLAPPLLERLDLQGKIVMGDALHTQQPLSVQIVAAGGEYLWYAKGNQPRLQADIAQTFQPERCGPGSSPLPSDFQTASRTAADHGRIEKRTLTTSSLLRGYVDWPALAQVFKLERKVWDLQRKPLRTEVVYGLTSLRAEEADATRLLALTRRYWGIESGLHYRRDVTLHEDATRMRDRQAAQVWATLNNLLVGLLAPLGFALLPPARRFFAAHLGDAVAVLTRRTL